MNMTQTDIEIYIQATNGAAIKAWLTTCTSSLEEKSSNPKRQSYWATFGQSGQPECEFEIIVLSKIKGHFSSVWFNTISTPWASDKACAQDAFIHFQSSVRCVVAGWQEGDAPDQWLNIDAQGESIIDWL